MLTELRERFPNWTIRQAPDPECFACKGGGVIGPTKRGIFAPCMCAVSDAPHGEAKANVMRAVGAAAKRIRQRDFPDA